MKIRLIAKNLCFFLAFLLLFYIESTINIVAFSVAFFVALVYCKQNVLVLSPLYIVAGVIVTPTLTTLIITIAPIVSVVVALFVHYKLRKKLAMITVGICTVVGILPSLIMVLSSDLIAVVLSLACSQASLYCFAVTLIAVVKKQLKFKLSKEELLAFCYSFAVLGMGCAIVKIVDYAVFWLFATIILLSMLYINQKLLLVLAVSLGVGGAIGSSDISFLALAVLYGGVAVVFDKDNHYLAGVCMLAVHVGYLLLFAEYVDFFQLIAPAVGVIIFIAIPKKYKNKLARFATCFAETELPRTLINRDRKHIAEKLHKLSHVFYDISDILHIEVADSSAEFEKNAIKQNTVQKYCATCPNYIICTSEIGCTDTSIMFEDVVTGAVTKGKATLLDTPTMLTSRCVRLAGLINYINDQAEEYKLGLEHKAHIDEGRAMVSDQMCGVGKLLDRLKGEVETSLVFNKEKEQELKDRLSSYNIAVNDAVIITSSLGEQVTLVLNERDIINPKLKVTVSQVMGYNMDISSKESMASGLCTIHFAKTAKYKVVYGSSQKSHVAGEQNGENQIAVKIDNTRVMLVLADGMGAGSGASKDSGYCVSMLESFYKAGFDHNTISQNVGRLLAIRASESFNAVDIAVIDTYNGYVDMVKQGGRESFIINNGQVEVVECGSLPMGIIADSQPLISRLNVKNNTTIVMVSDGIVDYIGRTELMDLLASNTICNPDMLADTIIEAVVAINGGQMADDASVLVARIIAI